MRLRDYQESVLADALARLEEQGPRSSIGIQLATGSGKTVIGLAALKEIRDPKRVDAWLTHRRELRDQSGGRMADEGLKIVDMAATRPHERRWRRGRVNVISPQTRRWPDLTDKPGLLVVDEAHHAPAATWRRLIRSWRDAGGQVLGLSGSWWRMSDREGFHDLFDHLIVGPSPQELQSAGWLSAPRVIQPQRAWISTRGAVLDATGEFARSWNEAEVLALLAQERAVEEWETHTSDHEDKRTMWFTPTVFSAEVLAEMLGGRCLTGDTPPQERDESIGMLRSGELTHLVSVDVLSEGLDLPAVPIIASLRTTHSLATYLQQCGRASRPNPSGHYTLLDFAVNVSRHGMPDADRHWSLLPRTLQEPGSLGTPPVASCYEADCAGVWLHPSHRHCWRCGAAQWMTCTDCAVERRWTQFNESWSVCSTCVRVRRVTEEEIPQNIPTLAEQRRAEIRALRAEKSRKMNSLRSFRKV